MGLGKHSVTFPIGSAHWQIFITVYNLVQNGLLWDIHDLSTDIFQQDVISTKYAVARAHLFNSENPRNDNINP